MSHRTTYQVNTSKGDGLEVVNDPTTGDFGFRVWRRSPSGVLKASGVTWVSKAMAVALATKIKEQAHAHDHQPQ